MNVIACITIRMSSARLPGKVMADICGKPALARVVDRYRQVKNVTDIVVATSTDWSDDPIASWCKNHDMNVYRGKLDDVCHRVRRACMWSDPDYILRGLGDCAFIESRLLDMMLDVVAHHGADTARVYAGPNNWPVYGAAESAYSWDAVLKMDRLSTGDEREHFGMYLDGHRDAFNVIYPLTPRQYDETYYRPYRLELDTPADLHLIREIYERLGPDREPPLWEVIALLDGDPDLAASNSHICERTGPLTSFDIGQRQAWARLAQDRLVDWGGDWSWLDGRTVGERAVWCDSGECYLGHVKRTRSHGKNVSVLIRGDGSIIGDGQVSCACGAGRRWYGSGGKRGSR